MNNEVLRIERLAQGGDGVGHLADGRVVFVPDAVPGDEVEIRVTKSKKRWARAEVVDVVKASPDRIPSDCQHDFQCGGCSFRHIRYEAELTAKVAAARDTLERIGGMEVSGAVDEVLRADAVDAYRVRAQLHIRGGSMGFLAPKSHDAFELVQCLAVDARIAAALPALRAFAADLRDGELLVETAGDAVVVSVIRGEVAPRSAQRLTEHRAVRGVATPGGPFGNPTVPVLDALGLTVDATVPAGRFRQAHRTMSKVLRELVVRRVGRGKLLDELYAGSGNFTFALAEGFESVRAYEVDRAAVAMGEELASALSLDHVEFLSADLDRDIPMVRDGATVLLDPPRTGADAPCQNLADCGAGRIVYVSCDVATLARDLKTLCANGAWQVDSVDFIDMFPRTAHIETVAVLRRCSPGPS